MTSEERLVSSRSSACAEARLSASPCADSSKSSSEAAPAEVSACSSATRAAAAHSSAESTREYSTRCSSLQARLHKREKGGKSDKIERKCKIEI